MPQIKEGNIRYQFKLLESWMDANEIRTDDMRFQAVTFAIDHEMAALVSTVQQHPPETGKYEAVKSILLTHYEDSPDQRIRSLLSAVQLNGRRPTAMLAEMRQLYNGPDSDIVRMLFLERVDPFISGMLKSKIRDRPANNPMSLIGIKRRIKRRIN